MLMVWLVSSVIASAAYLGYAIYFWGILKDPSTLSDLVSGSVALISLPSIFFVLLQQKKEEKRRQEQEKAALDKEIKDNIEREAKRSEERNLENARRNERHRQELKRLDELAQQRKREDVAQVFRVVNEVYSIREKLETHGFTIVHILEKYRINASQTPPAWDSWHNDKGVFEFLRVFYFSAQRGDETIYAIKGKRGMHAGLRLAMQALIDGYELHQQLMQEFYRNFDTLPSNISSQLKKVFEASHLAHVVQCSESVLKEIK